MRTQLPSSKRGRSPLPNFRPMSIVAKRKMALGMEVGLGPGHIVLNGDPVPLLKMGAEPPIFGPFWCRSHMFVSVICCSCNMRSCTRRLCRAIKLRDKIAGVTSVIQIIIVVSTTADVNHGWTSYLLVIIMGYSLHTAKLTVS